MLNNIVKRCFGDPDWVSYLDKDNNYHELSYHTHGFPFGVWDGQLIIGNDDDDTNNCMHDELIEREVMKNGWHGNNYKEILPASSVTEDWWDFDVLCKTPVKYCNEKDIDIIPKEIYYHFDKDNEVYHIEIKDFNGEEVALEEDEEYLYRIGLPENVIDDLEYLQGEDTENGWKHLEYEDRITYANLINGLGSPSLRGRVLYDFDNNLGFVAIWDNVVRKEDFERLVKAFGKGFLNYYYVECDDEEDFMNQNEDFNIPTIKDMINGNQDTIEASLSTQQKKQEKFINHLAKPEEKWKETEGWRNDRNREMYRRNQEDGWGNATQAEINWWKNKYIDENKNQMNKKILKEYGYSKDWPDISEIGTFEYSCYNDSDEYKEWLEYNNLQDSDEVRKEYFKDNVQVDLSFTDHEYYHNMGGVGDVYLEEIENEYGEELANMILNNCYNKFDSDSGEGSIEKADLYADVTVDLNDDDAINRFCSKYLPTSTEYHKGDRGFILSNGVIVYTESEHNEILAVPGLESKFQFIKMGNIRIMPNSIDIGQCPTFAQVRMLRDVINCYTNDELYIDLEGHPRAGNAGCRYDYPDDDEVIADIYRYYQDGIKPTGGHGHMRNNMYENKNKRIKKMKKNTIRLTESQLHDIIKESVMKLLKESEYTTDKFAQEQDELAFKNGDKGSFQEEATFIIFKDGTKHEVDEYHDDLDDIKAGLAKDGYREGKDYRVVTKPVSRHWSI